MLIIDSHCRYRIENRSLPWLYWNFQRLHGNKSGKRWTSVMGRRTLETCKCKHSTLGGLTKVQQSMAEIFDCLYSHTGRNSLSVAVLSRKARKYDSCWLGNVQVTACLKIISMPWLLLMHVHKMFFFYRFS